jgi:5-methylcytosine-specific restriction endonuclease McrA
MKPPGFSAEPFTETKEDRRISRNIPRDAMLKVVRGDGQVCRACYKNVPDNEIEFDHIIPHARGGPTTSENLRILCRKCNRKKSEALKEILVDDPSRK